MSWELNREGASSSILIRYVILHSSWISTPHFGPCRKAPNAESREQEDLSLLRHELRWCLFCFAGIHSKTHTSQVSVPQPPATNTVDCTSFEHISSRSSIFNQRFAKLRPSHPRNNTTPPPPHPPSPHRRFAAFCLAYLSTFSGSCTALHSWLVD